jgi:hypothetical protein
MIRRQRTASGTPGEPPPPSAWQLIPPPPSLVPASGQSPHRRLLRRERRQRAGHPRGDQAPAHSEPPLPDLDLYSGCLGPRADLAAPPPGPGALALLPRLLRRTLGEGRHQPLAPRAEALVGPSLSSREGSTLSTGPTARRPRRSWRLLGPAGAALILRVASGRRQRHDGRKRSLSRE